jgi:hypothetical protein
MYCYGASGLINGSRDSLDGLISLRRGMCGRPYFCACPETHLYHFPVLFEPFYTNMLIVLSSVATQVILNQRESLAERIGQGRKGQNKSGG